MNAMVKIALLGINRHFTKEHRIRNEIRSLGKECAIDGYGESGVDELRQFYKVQRPNRYLYRVVKVMGGLFPQFRISFENFFYRRLLGDIRSRGYRFLISHNIDDGLLALASGIPFVFHSHEYLPRQFDGNLLFRLTETRYRRCALTRLLSRAVLVIVEGNSVANMYASHFGILREKFCVMASMPAFSPRFEQSIGSAVTVKLIHHGILVPERGLELLLNIAALLGSKYHLTLMGPGPEAYIRKLKAAANGIGNISILSPVPYERIVETLHGYDLGLVVFGSPHFHHKHMTVPNKFWECLQARVPVLVSPESAMVAYVKESGCGVVAESATTDGYVKAIRGLTQEQISEMKTRCEEKAWIHSRDSWLEEHALKLQSAVDAVYSSGASHFE